MSLLTSPPPSPLTLSAFSGGGTLAAHPCKRSHPIRAMRAVVQRVAAASVEVEGKIVSEIGPGLLVLVGIHESDTDSDANHICRKVLNMRLFTNDSTGRHWDQNVMQKNYGVLLGRRRFGLCISMYFVEPDIRWVLFIMPGYLAVSQFTLYGIMKGNKPDFHVAMSPQKAKPFYESVVDRFRKSYKPDLVKDGIFGAMMKVNLINDGPVTMQLDSSPSSMNIADSEEP